MQLLLVLLLPAIVAPAVFYLLTILGDAVTSAALDQLRGHDD